MGSHWTLAELTELDVRLHPSRESEVPSDWQADKEHSRSSTLLKWVRLSRKTDPEAATIGRGLAKTEQWIRAGYFLFSLLAGLGAASALLRYGGEQLINVSAYVGVLVGGQLLLLIGLLVSSLWVRRHQGFRETLFLPDLLQDHPSPQSLPVWRWRLFTTFHCGGVLFNVGVLIATLWKVLAFDLAFGWATTLRIQPETVEAIIRGLSLPWGGHYAPSAEQIENSRIVLLEGFSSVDPASTAAWWPFLLMCVFMYGFLPRMVLACGGLIRVRSLLRHPPFDSPEVERLYQRLTRNTLAYQSEAESSSPPGSVTTYLKALTPTRPMNLEIPEDLTTVVDRDKLASDIHGALDISFTDSPEDAGICFLVEAWQPPLEETVRRFRDRRDQAGPEKEFLVLAVGYPDGDGTFQPPKPEHVSSWSRKLATLRDPNLGLLAWGNAS